MIRIALRFDDPSPVSKRHVEERVFQECFSRRIPLTCAVIPARLRQGQEIRFTPQRAGHLREAAATGLLDVAQHGYLHRDAGQASSGGRSEFRGVALPLQREWVLTGKRLLEEALQCPVTGFIPPWNSYDANTLLAVEEAGFVYFSAGRERPPGGVRRVPVLPSTCALGALEGVVRQALRFERQGPVVVVCMHHYDFDPDPDDPPYPVFSYEALGALLDRLAQIPQVRFVHLAQLAQTLTPKECRLWSKQFRLHESLPGRIRHRIPRDFLLTRLF